MDHIRVAAAGGLFLTVFFATASAEPTAPEPVSPGAAQEWARVAGPCPGFSWASAPGEGPLELTVYRFGEDDEPTTVVQKTLPGTAQSWTPSMSECLEPGESYAWSLRREGDEPGPWSEMFLFEVAKAPAEAEVSDAIGVIQRHLAEGGDAETAEALEPLTESGALDPETAESVRRALAERAGRADADARRGKARKPAPADGGDITATIGTKSIGEPAIIRGANQETSGVNYGVAGEASSPDGAALAASNLGGGADVALLDPDNPPGYLSEGGLVFDDASDVFFDFDNVGGGSVTLRQDGTELVTTATDQDTLGALSCGNGEVAKWDGSTWSCAADANTDTTYDAGTGLDLSTTTFSLDAAFTDDRYWKQGGNAGTDPAGDFLGTTDAVPFEIHIDGERALRLGPADIANVIGGWSGNSVDTDVIGATIGGGGCPDLGQFPCSSDAPNEVTADFGAIGGGAGNTASGPRVTTVGGGFNNTASDSQATVGGGQGNTASGRYSTVPGGFRNEAAGSYSFAAGRNAHAPSGNTFIWNDGSSYHDTTGDGMNDGFSSAEDVNGSNVTGAATFHISASGGVRIVTSDSTVTYIESGQAGWSTTSSRDAKTNIEPVSPEAALAGVSQMEIATWEYVDKNGQGQGTTHIGPMAEDFHDAFDVGNSNKHINSINANGAALAAIQGLHSELQSAREEMAALAERNDKLARRNDELAERLAALEAMVTESRDTTKR